MRCFANFLQNIESILQKNHDNVRLASVGILGKEWEPRVGKLGWHGDFETGFERNISFKVCGFFELF